MEQTKKFEVVSHPYQGDVPSQERREKDYSGLYERESDIIMNGGVILNVEMFDLGLRQQKGWKRSGWVTRFEIKYDNGGER